MFPRKKAVRKIFAFLLLLSTVLGVCILHFSTYPHNENRKFEAFVTELFQSELSGNTLNLHYTVANPEKMGISRTQPSLGRISTDPSSRIHQYIEYENALNEFAYSELSTSNRIALDTLLLFLHTEQTISDNFLLEEPLSPSLGIQAQLPVLLAEYTFRCQQDITDYLKLLQDIRPYFQSILAFEKKKAEAGLFMSAETLDRIQEQCRSFIENPESNYMLEVFSDKIRQISSISDTDCEKLLSLHQKLLLTEVVPAYEELISGLENLRSTCGESLGLSCQPGGKKYYQYLLRSNCGIYSPVSELEYRLSQQLFEDMQAIRKLLQKNPDLPKEYFSLSTACPAPDEMLEMLLHFIEEDFPPPVSTDYEISYVHESMEEFLSPAFYLTPPIDTGTPNMIYLNRASLTSALETFTTLAHEGFPGHLYQTTYFTAQDTHPVRSLFSCTGYVEGWATYVENYAYEYAASALELSSDFANLARLNRNATLCLYSLLDIGVHYRGWTEAAAAAFLTNFGISSEDSTHEIYLYIVENPCNYLQYYGGYLQFEDLKEKAFQKYGKDFTLADFHKAVLEIGPVPFPILEKYIL